MKFAYSKIIGLHVKVLLHGAMFHSTCLTFFGMTSCCVTCLVAIKIMVTAQKELDSTFSSELSNVSYNDFGVYEVSYSMHCFVKLVLHKVLHSIR